MKPDARLVVIEAFFAEPAEEIQANMIDTQVPLFDLHLMLAVNGKERSVAEYSALFDKVGLRTIKTEVLQLCSHPVVGWPDAPPCLFGLRFVQVATI
jgi:hypothetical protein